MLDSKLSIHAGKLWCCEIHKHLRFALNQCQLKIISNGYTACRQANQCSRIRTNMSQIDRGNELKTFILQHHFYYFLAHSAGCTSNCYSNLFCHSLSPHIF
ncbi:hypothetical protein D3C73_1332600 [compost metagenome]